MSYKSPYATDFHPGSEGAEGEEQYMHSSLSRGQFGQGPRESYDRAQALRKNSIDVAKNVEHVQRKTRTTDA